MKKLFAFILAPLIFAASAFAQPGPGPTPNPWVVSGSTIYYNNGAVLVPSNVTGGSKGVGTINAAGLYVGGNAVLTTASGFVGSIANGDGSLTISPTTGNVIASLAIGHKNVWTVGQEINLNGSTLPGAQTGTVFQMGQANGVINRGVELDSFAAPSIVTGVRADGTAASPTTLQAADEISSLNAFGYNGSAFVGPKAALRCFADQNWTTGANGTYCDIAVTPDGSTTMAEVVKFHNDGGVVFGSSGTDPGAGNLNLTGGSLTNNGTAPTGTGAYVRATSPTLVTPTLGAALATSINGNTFTSGTYTLTGGAGKTLTFNNSLTFAGTDSTTMTFPSTSATIARTDAGQTFTGTQAFGAITYTTLNGNTWAAGTGTLSIGAGKTLTASNSLTLAGTDSTTMTFPTTSATIARTDAAQTFTGIQTFSGNIVSNVTGSTQCLQANSSGTISGAGSACASVGYSATVLVVGGGASGGQSTAGTFNGGGGAAGDAIQSVTTLTVGTVYNVVVGAGGTGNNGQGRASSFNNVYAIGGGFGGNASAGQLAGNSGGSGGGAASNTVSIADEGIAIGLGNRGGNTNGTSGGGGGGMGSVGGDGGANGGAGGSGFASSITGSSVTYACGGGGATFVSLGSGGAAGCTGAGAGVNTGNGNAASANTGSGGGGGSGNSGTGVGGAGGSGVVIISVPTANYSGTTTGSPTVTTSGGNTIIKFTANGSYTG